MSAALSFPFKRNRRQLQVASAAPERRAPERRRAAINEPVAPVHGEAVCTQWGMDLRDVGCDVIIADSRAEAERLANNSTNLKSETDDKALVYRNLDASGTPCTGWIAANA